MQADAIITLLAPGLVPTKQTDGVWMYAPELDVRAMAFLMVGEEKRFVTITAQPAEAGRHRLIYHWDVDGLLVNFSTEVADGRAVSIADVCPAADWAERETRDFYAIEFEGSTDRRPLMVLPGDEPGFFNRTREAGHDADPAKTSYLDHTAEKGGAK